MSGRDDAFATEHVGAPFASVDCIPIEPPATVVVTGANGFIAQHCVAALLAAGYRVVGTTHGSHPNLSTVVVEDITSPQSYLAALGSLSPSAILHLAAPFHYNATNFEHDLMVPAVRGSTAILEAAAQIPSVTRIVHTNSFACIYDAAAGPSPEKTYTDGVQAANAPTAYRASKTAAEKAAWRFMEEQRGLGFDLVSLCPGMVFGSFLPESRPRSIEELNTSNLLVWAAVSAGKDSAVPPTKAPVWVDVRDVADAHVRALRVPEAGGARFLLGQGVYCNQELADVSRRVTSKFAERIPVGEPGRRESQTHFGVDASETERVLGIRWRGLDDCLGELVPQLFEIERSQQE
ncbi:hypothetical protein ACCO45_013738 [Purpureocillium lilacinum]|uniref:Uncharacterized protein n=1 Tax=Purpureocillium lilacinum TaxID=33203 RepID=A0ACC4D6U2_PURLI